MSTATVRTKAEAMRYSTAKRHVVRKKRPNNRLVLPILGLPKNVKFEFRKLRGIFHGRHFSAAKAVESYLAQSSISRAEMTKALNKVNGFFKEVTTKQVVIQFVPIVHTAYGKKLAKAAYMKPEKQRKQISRAERLKLENEKIFRDMAAEPFTADDRRFFDDAFASIHHDPI